ncbi:short chain enoyl-CoA hydratase [Sphingobium sp. AP50]|uniref:enoyl-CoA hydratase/isomerase family protein n=1 Tax=Sphingobium sp. AP50 TaxID=1884369 RepID=UPI0008ACCDCC|nr:enoyl-CoA hydratase-related protein [Sphingobium sp. AP50]SEJ66234.1 short chain enoyl-CoA hydratase [Sphingobium sp. AP50]
MTIELSRLDNLALLTINRPHALNALSFAIIQEIGSALDAVAGMADVRALLITGAGDKAFCAGADIKELRNRPLIDQKRGSEFGQGVFAKLDTLPVASIALINGYAFGGGLELALACTFRLASPVARMGLPEIKLGLIPGYGGTQRLPRLVGESRALEMILTGRTLNAAEAAAIGLVNKVVEGDLIAAGKAFAAEFAGYSLRTLEFARRAVQRAEKLPLVEGLRVEADLSTLAYRTADAEEGMAAFEEKRRPEFKDD